MWLGTFVRVFSASPFATRTGGKSTIARGGWRRRSAAAGGFITIWLSEAGKDPEPFCRSCAIGYCATQSSMTESCQFRDRASCLPESSRRALVADAREIRQYQMHPSSLLKSVTDAQPVALLFFFAGCPVNFRPPRAIPLSISTSILGFRIFSDAVCTASPQPRPESLLCGTHLPLSTVDCRPPCKLPGAHPMNLQAEFFSDMLDRPCFRGVESTMPC